ncbi:hypothetical protein KJ605_01920 [Patescibacteria group bacterium]|nr:hypothetical protein [Patescibacteria group bacterium]MBU1970511.1 hypothetical protein [Patescibacteria group bacterium]
MPVTPGLYLATTVVFWTITVITKFKKPVIAGFFSGTLCYGILVLIGMPSDAQGLLISGAGFFVIFLALSLLGRTREKPAD